MLVEKMKMADLRQPERNVRMHPDKQIQEFMRSIKMFGQTRPIVVDENNTILIGCGLYKAMQRLDYEEADVLKRIDLSESDKKKLMIADNKIYSLGVDDLDATNDFLKEILDYDVPGFDEDVLKMIMADADEVTEKIAEYGVLEEGEIEKIQQKTVPKVIPEQLEQKSEEAEKPAGNIEKINPESEPQESQKPYVICQECGAKVWLS